MIQDRSTQIFGNFKGVLSTGDNSIINQNKIINSNNLIDELQNILEDLATRYSVASFLERQAILKMEIRQKLKSNPTFRDRFINALKAGGVEMVKVFTNNPFVSVPLETVKGWIEAEAD
ncbi:hypothetical protein [Nostoc sp.]|uniref:hypothetical protein n=1 Tax=Nostoc sp. TaxID=1180 RepID=UPI002FF5711C